MVKKTQWKTNKVLCKCDELFFLNNSLIPIIAIFFNFFAQEIARGTAVGSMIGSVIPGIGSVIGGIIGG